jgi:hypothetical protein
MTNEQFYINKCKELIEQKLAWGDSTAWQNQDFESLSEKIFEETKISLSVSTLKRIWGKVKYDGSPNVATLNPLAQFVGYENWRTFTSNGFQPKEVEITEIPKKHSTFKPLNGIATFLGIVVFISLLVWIFKSKSSKSLTFKNLSFTSKVVTIGVPNTVVFQYNAADSNADSVFIQQSWDSQRRFKVDKTLNEYISTYYMPGYFRAKLVLNDSIVKEHDLFIASNGWLGTIDHTPIPTYLPQNKIHKNGIIGVSEEDLITEKVDLSQNRVWASFFNVSEKNVVSSKHFVMETEVRNTFSRGEGVCQQSKIILLGSEGVIAIPLSIKGCIGELSMVLGEQFFNGKTFDFSAFGVNFNDFVKVTCEVKDQKIRLFINQQIAYKGDFKHDIGKIVGTRIGFLGTGEVKSFVLKDSL